MIGGVEVWGTRGGGSDTINWSVYFPIINTGGTDNGNNNSDPNRSDSGGGDGFYNPGSNPDELLKEPDSFPKDNYRNRCNLSLKGFDFLKSWEKGPSGGPALTPYDDNGNLPGGNMTIGWGHKIKKGEDFSAGITAEIADLIFLADLQISINDVNNSVPVLLTQNQFDALVSYSYNIGCLINSPACLKKLNSGDYEGAAAEMDIVTQDEVVLNGLVNRREDEQTMFNDGIYNFHN